MCHKAEATKLLHVSSNWLEAWKSTKGPEIGCQIILKLKYYTRNLVNREVLLIYLFFKNVIPPYVLDFSIMLFIGAHLFLCPVSLKLVLGADNQKV